MEETMKTDRLPRFAAPLLFCLLLAIAPSAVHAAVIDPATPFVAPLPSAKLLPTSDTDKPLNHRSGEIARFGYIEEEYSLSGTANIYAHDASNNVEIASQGNPYTTRVLVRRPRDARDFSGNVVVEVYNSTAGVDKDVEFIQSKDFLLRHGDVWIGITTNTGAVAALQIYGTANDTSRYAPLNYADNGLAWDALSQLGTLLRHNRAAGFLSDLRIDRVYAMGESGSAQALVLYINEIHPLTRLSGGGPIYSGFIVSERFGTGNAFNSSSTPSAAAAAAFPPCDPHLVLHSEVPIINLQTQNEIITDREYCVRRDDSNVAGDQFRLWEMAGSAHLTPFVSRDENSDRDLDGSSFVAATYLCTHSFSQNDFPKEAFLQAALSDLYDWVDRRMAPPIADRISLTSATPPAFVLDSFGNVAGGVRSPFVDEPIFTWFPADTTVTSSGPLGSLYCSLFGYKVPFTSAQLTGLYRDHDDYEDKVERQAREMVRERFLLPRNANAMIRQAERADIP
jgi:Alpha/beta hydrolase domain